MLNRVTPDVAAPRPGPDGLLAEVLEGLRRESKTLPCKYFYDARGAELFEAICRLDEYYLTRAELEIMDRYAGDMAHRIGSQALVLELGSGDGAKTRLLLARLEDPIAYVPIDISNEQLADTAARLRDTFPGLAVLPVCTDYTRPFVVPAPERPPRRRVAYFPGSTVGNFEPPEARAFFAWIAELCGAGGGLVVGVDLRKGRSVLEAAYNDREGVTAAFNLNILAHINREVGADFHLDRFRHFAVYNEDEGRIEMYLESLQSQRVMVGGEPVEFGAGETVCTEYSYKYGLDQFAALVNEAGFDVAEVWCDRREYFSVHYLEVRVR